MSALARDVVMPRSAGTAGAETKEISRPSSQDSTAAQDSAAVLVAVDSVLVADRYRHDLGEVTGLARSIVNIGLLNPITVISYHGGFRLVAGERRLRAFESLGLAEIPARIARDIVEARDLLVAERDENTERKPMLPSESAALGMAIEAMERPAALDRQASSRFGAGPGTRTGDEVRPRDIAAEAIGMGEATYRRIKTIMGVAADENETEEVREVAQTAVAAIDAGAPVRGEYDRVKEVRRKSESVTVETGKPKRANDPTEYIKAMAVLHPTVRIAFDLSLIHI